MKLPLTLAAAAAALLFLGAPNSHAVIIGTTGYEGAPTFETGYYYTYIYDYAGYGAGAGNVDLGGSVVTSLNTVAAGLGTGGSGGFEIAFDGSAVPIPGQGYPNPGDPTVEYSYYGVGAGSGLAVLSPIVSLDLSQYRLSLDLRAVGMLTGFATLEFALEFQAPDDTLGVDPGTNGDILLTLNFTELGGTAFYATSEFGQYTVMLDQYASLGPGSLANFQQYVDQIVNVNVAVLVNRGAQEFGYDGGNAVYVDNQTLEHVPEPGIAGLLAVAGVVLGGRRRR